MEAKEGQVNVVPSVEAWKQLLADANESKKLVVVDFTATWCPPCRFIAPFFAELAEKYAHVIFLKVDVDELKSVAEEWNVNAMPTFIFLKEGKEVDQVVGANKAELERKIQMHAGGATASA